MIIQFLRIEPCETEIEVQRLEIQQLQRQQFFVQSAQVADRFTIIRKALTCAGVHSSHRMTGCP
jgi:hypothetical protein